MKELQAPVSMKAFTVLVMGALVVVVVVEVGTFKEKEIIGGTELDTKKWCLTGNW